MKPHQIISLMTFKGADNTLAMGDHADHIHIGFARPLYGANTEAAEEQIDAILKPDQWDRADRPPGRDRQPGRPAQPVEVRPQESTPPAPD